MLLWGILFFVSLSVLPSRGMRDVKSQSVASELSRCIEANTIFHAGWDYRTLDNVVPGNATLDCQHSYIEMPLGWELAPQDADVTGGVVAHYPWGAGIIVLSDGSGWRTSGASESGEPGTLFGTSLLHSKVEGEGEIRRHSYKPDHCSLRILIRQKQTPSDIAFEEAAVDGAEVDASTKYYSEESVQAACSRYECCRGYCVTNRTRHHYILRSGSHRYAQGDIYVTVKSKPQSERAPEPAPAPAPAPAPVPAGAAATTCFGALAIVAIASCLSFGVASAL